MAGAFHAYDIRGVYGQDFDAAVAYKVGYFIPSLLGAGEVLVGRDCRVSSQEIHDALVRGITDSGADVCDIGLSSTPMVYFATASYGFKASVQITASHNAPEYNGLKVSRENALPVGYDTGLGEIERRIGAGDSTPAAQKRGKVRTMDILDDYLAFMRRFKGDYSNIRIAFDLSNGMANLFAREIFGDAPAYIFDTIDGRFPNHEPNPLVASNREALRHLVLETGADVGVIYDGDADRVMFLDETGRFVPPDLVIALMSEYFIGERGAKSPVVLQEIRSSKAVAEYLEPLGAEVRTWKVGRAFAAPRLREIDGLWGGELAGHYYFKDFFYSDSGLLSSEIVLRIVSALKKKGTGLAAMVDKLIRYRNSGEINFKLEHKKEAMDALRDFFVSQDKPLAGMDFDGYRVEFADWWFNVRPSNTEPYLRFICEARDDELLSLRVAQAKEIIAKFD
ncbi:MAG: phosphomannomutase/phosphoglucomutase [Bacteroidales bacterium]|nr:phosphomannomutase/phosphoglucomutase [Candidatus Cryptobacteroides fimicaballi]